MITREELTDKVARDSWEEDGTGTPWVSVPVHLREVYIKRTRIVIRIALEAAIEIAREQRRPYSEHDPDEAHNYAIGDVTDAIRSLIPENDND